jgi:hypothetical protein
MTWPDDAWNAALAARSFNEDFKNRPSYLAVDDDDLVKIAKANGWGAGTPGLEDAIGKPLRAAGTVATFLPQARAWRRSGDKRTSANLPFVQRVPQAPISRATQPR